MNKTLGAHASQLGLSWRYASRLRQLQTRCPDLYHARGFSGESRESSKRNYYIISPRVIIKAIIIIVMARCTILGDEELCRVYHAEFFAWYAQRLSRMSQWNSWKWLNLNHDGLRWAPSRRIAEVGSEHTRKVSLDWECMRSNLLLMEQDLSSDASSTWIIVFRLHSIKNAQLLTVLIVCCGSRRKHDEHAAAQLAARNEHRNSLASASVHTS